MNGYVTLSVPGSLLLAIGAKFMPPVIEFGSPTQRAKDEQESFWHIPVRCRPKLWNKIGPATLTMCRVYLDKYEGERIVDKIRLCFGDATFEPIKDEAWITKRVVLIPIAWRSEKNNDRKGYFADFRLINNQTKAWEIEPSRKKYKFKLRIESKEIKCRESPHFYIIRCPESNSNGHFTVEIEYEGAGTQ